MDFKSQPHYIEVPLRVKRLIGYKTVIQPFYFNMAAWWSLWESNDFDWEIIDKLPDDAKNLQLIFEAAKQGSYVNGKVFPFTFKKFIEGIDHMYGREEKLLRKAFVDSIPKLQETVGKIQQGAKKK